MKAGSTLNKGGYLFMSRQKSTEAKVAVNILRFLMGLILNLVFYAAAFAFIYYLAGEAYTFAYQVFGSQVVDSAPGRNITITVNDEDTMQDVAETLEQQGIIINQTSFVVRAVLTEKEIHPGTYTVNSSQSYAEILEILNME